MSVREIEIAKSARSEGETDKSQTLSCRVLEFTYSKPVGITEREEITSRGRLSR